MKHPGLPLCSVAIIIILMEMNYALWTKTTFLGESGQFGNGNMSGLDGERYVFIELPKHEVPTRRAEKREFSVGALQANRVLHDAVWISTVF